MMRRSQRIRPGRNNLIKVGEEGEGGREEGVEVVVEEEGSEVGGAEEVEEGSRVGRSWRIEDCRESRKTVTMHKNVIRPRLLYSTLI